MSFLGQPDESLRNFLPSRELSSGDFCLPRCVLKMLAKVSTVRRDPEPARDGDER